MAYVGSHTWRGDPLSQRGTQGLGARPSLVHRSESVPLEPLRQIEQERLEGLSPGLRAVR